MAVTVLIPILFRVRRLTCWGVESVKRIIVPTTSSRPDQLMNLWPLLSSVTSAVTAGSSANPLLSRNLTARIIRLRDDAVGNKSLLGTDHFFNGKLVCTIISNSFSIMKTLLYWLNLFIPMNEFLILAVSVLYWIIRVKRCLWIISFKEKTVLNRWN